ncbi:hypothetical protein JNB62_13220 [Microbacterium jejuense]|uniref:Uncharacterized protein n=1 Tax=Microbacterium jejuense TaxID=1263637 RepID=A0ABS7HNW8_9MICO|nr:hypothetical protein [Microbacterium jejuense]MBW9094651.1 hypothetical protein [Microbacterium jejuense]
MPYSYSNGRVPEAALVQLDSGTTGRGRHVSTPASALRWYLVRRDVQRETGVTLHISPGMNAYRDYDEQVIGRTNACAAGNCLAAASAGSSSHGGNMAYPFTNWVRVDAMAFDIGDYWRIPWATFKGICERYGLEVGLITRAIAGIDEPWHIIDRRPYQALAELEAQYGVTLTRGADGVYRLTELTPEPKGDDAMQIFVATSDGAQGLIQKGVSYVQDAEGPLRPLSTDEYNSYVWWRDKGQPLPVPVRITTWSGDLIEGQVNRYGLREMVGGSAADPVNNSRLSGRIRFSATDVRAAVGVDPAQLAIEVWKHGIQAQDQNGNWIPGVFWEARGYLASIAAQVGATSVDVDEAALATQLAPLLIGSLDRLSAEDVERLAVAAADEQDRRERERLAQ